jgi:CheY-like chemotaxis protein
MGGSIDVRSTEFHGTTFFFRVPLGLAKQAGDVEVVVASFPGKRVLVIDDCSEARVMFEKWLEYFGLTAGVCSITLEGFQKLESEGSFDLILLDDPVSWAETAAFFQHLEKTAQSVRVIIATTQRREDLEAQLRNMNDGAGDLAARIAGILEKPVTPNNILQGLELAFGSNGFAHFHDGPPPILGANRVCALPGDVEKLTLPSWEIPSTRQVRAVPETHEEAAGQVRSDSNLLPPDAESATSARGAGGAGEMVGLIGRLKVSLADGDPDAELASAELARYLAGTKLGARALDLSRHASRFDFEDAQKVLNEIGSELEKMAAI